MYFANNSFPIFSWIVEVVVLAELEDIVDALEDELATSGIRDLNSPEELVAVLRELEERDEDICAEA